MSFQNASVTLSSVVNDVIQTHPSSTAVFNDFGIDACCGGAVSIHDAALRDGADPAALLRALNAAIVDSRASTGTVA
jgi:iron-sulfur cluster repair protein YtfE (RIC family)